MTVPSKKSPNNPVELYAWDEANNRFKAVTVSPGGGIATDSPAYRTEIEEDSVDADIKYVGNALPGSATSDPVWQIMKLDKSASPLSRTWANAGEFTATWDDRETETYT